MRNKITLSMLALVLSQPLFAQGQTKSGEGISSVIWANGSGTAGIRFALNGKTISGDWFSGANSGAGSKETTKWLASFIPPEPAIGFSTTLGVEAGSSSIAVLIGDFWPTTSGELEATKPTASEKPPAGYTKVSEKEFTRATMLHFPIQKDAAETYPVHLLNGIPGSTVTVIFRDSKSFQLTYATPQIYTAAVGVEIHMSIQVNGQKEIAGFKLDPLERGGLLVFYRKVGQQAIQKMFVNLHSIESLKIRSEMIQKEEEN